VDAQQNNILVKRLKSEKSSLNLSLVNTQDTLQRIQHANQKLANMLHFEEGVSGLVKSCSSLSLMCTANNIKFA